VYEHKPGFTAATVLYAKLLYLRQEYSGCLAVLDGLRKSDPANIEVAVWCAQSYLQLQRDAEAEKLILGALEKYPDEPRLSFISAIIAERHGAVSRALSYLKNAESLQDELALIFLESARLHFQIGNITQAQSYIEKAKNLVPDNEGLTAAVHQIEAAIRKGNQKNE
jgi:tetratricopeptide (TPR) repeat protein